MKYSVDEIARMRRAVMTLTGSEGAEDRLRTYMANETMVEELETAVTELEMARQRDRGPNLMHNPSDAGWRRQLEAVHWPF